MSLYLIYKAFDRIVEQQIVLCYYGVCVIEYTGTQI